MMPQASSDTLAQQTISYNDTFSLQLWHIRLHIQVQVGTHY